MNHIRIVRWTVFGALVLLCALVPKSLYPEQSGIQILAQKSFYSPSTIHVKKGVPVRLLIKAADVPHGFAIDEFGIAREISPGAPVTVQFTPDHEGQFPFYCVVRCGKEHLQMRGTIVVEP